MQQYQGWWQLFTCCHGLRLVSQESQQNMNLVANKMYLHVLCQKGVELYLYIQVLVGEVWKYSCAIGYL